LEFFAATPFTGLLHSRRAKSQREEEKGGERRKKELLGWTRSAHHRRNQTGGGGGRKKKKGEEKKKRKSGIRFGVAGISRDEYGRGRENLSHFEITTGKKEKEKGKGRKKGTNHLPRSTRKHLLLHDERERRWREEKEEKRKDRLLLN